MTNEERRKALAKARRKALEFAEAAEIGGIGSVTPEQRRSYIDHAVMWAAVAEAMKVGENREADGVIDADGYSTRDGWE